MSKIKSWLGEINGIESSLVYVCGDIHAYHKNLTSGTSEWADLTRCRNFVNESVMTDHVINNINDIVGEDDLLISGGDWSFGGIDNVKLTRDSINCKRIIHIFGNHDHNIRRHKDLQQLFIWCGDYLELRVGKTLVNIFHYPIASFNEIGHDSVHIHFHSHGSFNSIGRSMDCGLDTNDLKPYKLDDVIERLKNKQLQIVDHHDGLSPQS